MGFNDAPEAPLTRCASPAPKELHELIQYRQRIGDATILLESTDTVRGDSHPLAAVIRKSLGRNELKLV